MKTVLTALCLLALSAPPAWAVTPQQEKMKQCNKDAEGKRGPERRAFMHECLSAKATGPKTAQQDKKHQCTKDAEGKKGDERKTFMKECLAA